MSTNDQKLPEVIVVMSVYNEERSVEPFLKQILNQEAGCFLLKKIIVCSDGSIDDTVGILQRLNIPSLEIQDFPDRQGKSRRLQALYAVESADVFVQVDPDIHWPDSKVLSRLLAPFAQDPTIGLVSGRVLPLSPQTFPEKALGRSALVFDHFRSAIRDGQNKFSVSGAFMALAKNLAQHIVSPATIAEDTFSYLTCKQRGCKHVYAKNAVVYMRLPQTIRDHVRQMTRFSSAPRVMKRYFPSNLVNFEYRIPRSLYLKAFLKEITSHPVLSVYLITINSYCWLRARFGKGDQARWEIARSTRQLS